MTAVTAGVSMLTLAACSSKKSHPLSPTSGAVVVDASEDAAASSAVAVGNTVTGFSNAQSTGEANLTSAIPFRLGSVAGPAQHRATAQTACTPGSTGLLFTESTDSAFYVRMWEYFSGPVGAGTCQNAYDASTTDSVQFSVVDTSYLNTSSSHTHSYHNAGHYVVGDTTGAATPLGTGTDRFWTGVDTVTDTINVTRSNFSVAYTWIAYDSTHNVGFPHPLGGDTFPISGMWSRTLNGTATYSNGITGSTSITRYMTLSFTGASGTGASQDTLKVYTSNGGTLLETCVVDLASGTLVSNCVAP